MTQFCTTRFRGRRERCEMPEANGHEEAGVQNDVGGPAGALLDVPNRAIIEALQRDGRQPYGAIAEEVGLSEAAVRRRVQRLREAGIMQIVAVTDPLQLGFTRQAMVGISVEGDVRQVAEKLSALAEVDYVVMCARSFDPRHARDRDLLVPEADQADLLVGHAVSGPGEHLEGR